MDAMQVRVFFSPADFLSDAGGFLRAREVHNSLLLGLALRMSQRWGVGPASGVAAAGDSGPGPLFCVVEEQGRILAAALHCPPFRMVLSGGPRLAIAALADHLACMRRSMAGIFAPAEAADLFRLAWGKLSRDSIHRGRRVRLYHLRTVVAAPVPSGQFTEASWEDFDLLVGWSEAFSREVGETSPVEHRELVKAAIEERRQFVWKDPHPVSMAAWTRPTPRTAAIHYVYTPPEFRGRGYAKAIVAALSRKVLELGKRSCVLFADVENVVASGIYARIGYRAVCDFGEYIFTPRQ